MTRRLAFAIVMLLILGVCRFGFADRRSESGRQLGVSISRHSTFPAPRVYGAVIHQSSIQPSVRPQIANWQETLLTDRGGRRGEIALTRTQDRTLAVYVSKDNQLIAAEEPKWGVSAQSTVWQSRILHSFGRKFWYQPQLELVAYPSGRVGAAFVSNQMSLLYSEWEPDSTEVETVTVESDVPALPMSLGIRAFTDDQPSLAYFSHMMTGDPQHPQSLYRLRIAALGDSTKRKPTLTDRPWDAMELAQYSIANGPAVEGAAAAYNRLSRSGVIGTNRTDRGPAYAWTDPVSGEIQVAQLRGYDDPLSRTAWMLHSTGVAGVPRTFHEQQPSYDHYVNPAAPTQPILTMGVESLDQHSVRWMSSTSTIPGGPDDWNIHVVDAYGSRPGEVVEISRSSGSITGIAQLYYTAGDELRRATTFGDLPTAANHWQVLGIPWHQSSQIAKASFWHQGVLAAEEDGLVQYRW